MTPEQEIQIIQDGDTAFLMLMNQVDHLLGHIDFYMTRYADDARRISQLEDAVMTFCVVPPQLANVIKLWKLHHDRVLDKFGVELFLLNELWITIDAVAGFFERQGFDIYPFNYEKAESAFNDLIRINRIIP